MKEEISDLVTVKVVNVVWVTLPNKNFIKKYATEKGEGIMKCSVTYENGQIFQHFGHTAEFKVYDVQDEK